MRIDSLLQWVKTFKPVRDHICEKGDSTEDLDISYIRENDVHASDLGHQMEVILNQVIILTGRI